jgi:hypothetical protein
MNTAAKAGDLVLVNWTDSQVSAGAWEALDGLDTIRPLECTSVGWVLDVGSNYLTIVHNRNEHQVLGRTTIPKRSIRSVKMLR